MLFSQRFKSLQSNACMFFDRAFKLDEDNALLTYVKQQLLPPMGLPSTGRSPVTQDNSMEELTYQQNVSKVVHKISCTTSLLKLLVEVGSKVIQSNFVYPIADFELQITSDARSSGP